MDLLIGADPEFFVKKEGKFVSAYGLIEGTKKNPQKVKGGAVQVDGMALEININPANNFTEFEKNLNDVMANLRMMVPKEYEFAFVPVADFDADYIKDQPEEARVLGCDPDFNAYTGEPNNPPNAAATFRTASGHWHLGWTEDEDIKNPEHIDACQMITRQLDSGVGLESVVYDPDTRRRELYGKAGAYRPKPYGVEYRVMSNFWLNDWKTRESLFQHIKLSFDKLIGGSDWEKLVIGNSTARKIINSSDVKKAYDYASYIFTRSRPLINAYDKWIASLNHAQAIGPEKAEIAKLKRKTRAVKKAGFEPDWAIVDDVIVGQNPVLDIEVGAAGPAPNQFINADWVDFGNAQIPIRDEAILQRQEDADDIEALLAEIGAQNA